MGGKKKTKVRGYIPGALEFFGTSLELIRYSSGRGEGILKFQVNIDGLQSAIQALPKEDRENVEKFWGLTGGPNHSKKLINPNTKDVAFLEMRNKAVLSLRKLQTLDYMIMYDGRIKGLVNEVSQKVDKRGIDISDIEITKLIMAFSVYIENGPQMSFEEQPTEIDTSLDGSLLFDENDLLHGICQEIQKLPDKSINLRLLISLFEMIDFQEMLVIKKSIGIDISKFFEKLQVIKKGQGIQNINDFSPKDVEVVRSVAQIRELKERMFPYGKWEVTTELILGDVDKKLNLEGFKEALQNKEGQSLVTKVEGFKTSQIRQIRTSKGIRTLYVYQIGGLEFTDPQEIDFLYLYGDLA